MSIDHHFINHTNDSSLKCCSLRKFKGHFLKKIEFESLIIDTRVIILLTNCILKGHGIKLNTFTKANVELLKKKKKNFEQLLGSPA